MQIVSNLYNTIVSSENHWFETKLVIDGVGEYYEADGLFSISTSLQMFSGTPSIGGAVAGEIEVKMLYPEDVTIPTMAVLRPYIRANGKVQVPSGVSIVNGILTFQSGAAITNDVLVSDSDISWISPEDYLTFSADRYDDATSEWLPQGVFYVDTRERTVSEANENILVLHGFDAMLKAEQIYGGRITGDSTDIQMVNEIAYQIGVPVDSRTTALMTASYTIPLPTGYSYREVLGYIASMYVGCFIITDEGKLRLVSLTELPPETNYLIDEIGDAIIFGGDRILV